MSHRVELGRAGDAEPYTASPTKELDFDRLSHAKEFAPSSILELQTSIQKERTSVVQSPIQYNTELASDHDSETSYVGCRSYSR